jgi:hypothetical protein
MADAVAVVADVGVTGWHQNRDASRAGESNPGSGTIWD